MFASLSWLKAAELAPSLQTDMEVKDAIQGAIQGENSEVVQIVSSVATWGTLDWYAAQNCPLKHDLTSLTGTTEVNSALMQAILSKSPQKKTEDYHFLQVLQSGNVHKELEKIKSPALTGGRCH